MKLTDQELEKLLEDTDSFYDCPTEEDKQKMRDAYRKVEEETNQQIAEAGSITKWYESGRGRRMEEDKLLEREVMGIYFRQTYSGFGQNSDEDVNFITKNKFIVFVDEDTKNNGYDSDKEKVKQLELNYPYILKTMNVGRSSSTLELEEFPGQSFNTVNFKFAVKNDKTTNRTVQPNTNS
jgi:hypothetical protein